MSDPVRRNAWSLTANAAITSGLGLVFWAVAIRRFGSADVGRAVVDFSLLSLAAGLAQLGLEPAIQRYLPVSGRHRERMVGAIFVVVFVASFVAAGVLLLLPYLRFANGFGFTRFVIVGVVIFSLSMFTLIDQALLVANQAPWIPLENGLHSVVKLGTLFLFGTAGAVSDNIVLVIIAPLPFLLAAVVLVLDRHYRNSPPAVEAPQDLVPAIVRAASWEFTGVIAAHAAVRLLPVILAERVSDNAAAYFALPWLVWSAAEAISLQLVGSAVGSSGGNLLAFRSHLQSMAKRAAGLLAAGALGCVLLGPMLLRILRPQYAAAATSTLQLLPLSAPGVLANGIANTVDRMHEQMRKVTIAYAFRSVVTIVAMLFLVSSHPGPEAAALAWILGQTVGAAIRWSSWREIFTRSVVAPPVHTGSR